MATQPLFGNPTVKARVWSKYAVLLGALTADTPVHPAAYTLNDPVPTPRTASVTTTTGAATITAPAGTFSAADVGSSITGTGIPASTTILSFQSATDVTMSANATASGTVTATITPQVVTTQWDPVGALVEDNPFDDGTETIQSSDHTAAGFGVYATTYSQQKETITFQAKETTLLTLGILYDASDLAEAAGAISGNLKQRDPSKKFLVAFHRENSTECERRTSINHAYIDSITRQTSNNESVWQVALVIVPTTDKELYDYYLGPKA